jgi:hypothetical protein
MKVGGRGAEGLAEKNIKAYCNATTDKEHAEIVREMARRRSVPVIGNHMRKWFEIDQEVKYRTLYGKVLVEGTGRTVDMSSGGVWLTTEDSSPLTSGMQVELAIHWPVLLNYTCPMKLMIYGYVVRSHRYGTLVAFERYELRTRSVGLYHVAPGR